MHPPSERSFATTYHAPVLVHEILDFFKESRVVIDCTLGGGGHSQAFLEDGKEKVYGIDRDPTAIREASERLAGYKDRFVAVLGDFTKIDQIYPLNSVRPDAILADLGVSSHQLDDESRGFSFRPGVSLDMRMEEEGGLSNLQSAATLLNTMDESSLADIFYNYGDEPKSRRVASEVVRRRNHKPFETSDDLVNAIRSALGPRSGPGDFARIFQAVRIAVNDEMNGLDEGLVRLKDKLTPGGVLAIISYHSGEDRRVKNAFRDWSTKCKCPPIQFQCTCSGVSDGTLVVRKAVTATPEEARLNSRARSAKLRVWRKSE